MKCPGCEKDSFDYTKGCKWCNSRKDHYKRLTKAYKYERSTYYVYWVIDESPGGRTYVGLDQQREMAVILEQRRDVDNISVIYVSAKMLKDVFDVKEWS